MFLVLSILNRIKTVSFQTKISSQESTKDRLKEYKQLNKLLNIIFNLLREKGVLNDEQFVIIINYNCVKNILFCSYNLHRVALGTALEEVE